MIRSNMNSGCIQSKIHSNCWVLLKVLVCPYWIYFHFQCTWIYKSMAVGTNTEFAKHFLQGCIKSYIMCHVTITDMFRRYLYLGFNSSNHESDLCIIIFWGLWYFLMKLDKKEKQDSIVSIEEKSVSVQNSDNSSTISIEVKVLVNDIDVAINNIKEELDELERRQQNC